MNWLQRLLGYDHGFAVWSETKDHPIQHTASHTAEYSAQPRLRPTVYKISDRVSQRLADQGPPGSFLCDSWPPDDVIIRAREVLEEEGRRQTRPPFRQAAPAFLLLTLAVVALAVNRGTVTSRTVNAAEPTSRVAHVPHSWRYAGPDHGVVRLLLTRVDGWSVPACDSCAGMDTPRVKVGQRCERDGSVAAAVQYAWAAEAYASVGRDERAVAAAASMRNQLDNVKAACMVASRRGSRPPGSCATAAIWPCPV